MTSYTSIPNLHYFKNLAIITYIQNRPWMNPINNDEVHEEK
jgi:hypothetical protein